jgi:sulfide:quinone oxidoreductase
VASPALRPRSSPVSQSPAKLIIPATRANIRRQRARRAPRQTRIKETRMDIRKITDDFSVAPQIRVTDVSTIAAAGFRAVICNRPDGEAADQPRSDDVAAAVTASGMAWRMLPVTQISRADVEAFDKLLTELPKPVLAFCRSGTRCTTLWSLREIDKRPVQDILERTRAAGYDMAALVQRAAGPRD